MYRDDDEWIEEMLYCCNRFQRDYVVEAGMFHRRWTFWSGGEGGQRTRQTILSNEPGKFETQLVVVSFRVIRIQRIEEDVFF
jgi:hypothetical protein